jgi:hypothetical protein
MRSTPGRNLARTGTPTTPACKSTPGRPCRYVRGGRSAGRKGCSDRRRTDRSRGDKRGGLPYTERGNLCWCCVRSAVTVKTSGLTVVVLSEVPAEPRSAANAFGSAFKSWRRRLQRGRRPAYGPPPPGSRRTEQSLTYLTACAARTSMAASPACSTFSSAPARRPRQAITQARGPGRALLPVSGSARLCLARRSSRPRRVASQSEGPCRRTTQTNTIQRRSSPWMLV